MPTYEYKCEICGARFTRWQHFTDPPVQLCPNGHHTVRRVFSPPAIVFKGSGFYVTDNRRNGGGRDETTKS
ncbi:MAG: FmdB family zinc ribbon protein [Chloroflexota bacterium]|nr:FmdB family zinc ribbon protein [Chloroflexota bacterium]